MKSSDEKKVLFVSGRFPFPLHKGDQLVLFNNIRLVSQKYKVTLITFYDNESELENLHKIKKYCEKVVLIKRFAIFSYINIIFSIFRLEPMQVSYYRSGLFKKKLNLLLSVDRFDLIHVYMLRMAHYVKDIPTPKVIGLIDSMHLNGAYTLGENIGDLGGVQAAYEGLQIFLQKNGRPEKIDGYTPEQRFFLSWGTALAAPSSIILRF